MLPGEGAGHCPSAEGNAALLVRAIQEARLCLGKAPGGPSLWLWQVPQAAQPSCTATRPLLRSPADRGQEWDVGRGAGRWGGESLARTCPEARDHEKGRWERSRWGPERWGWSRPHAMQPEEDTADRGWTGKPVGPRGRCKGGMGAGMGVDGVELRGGHRSGWDGRGGAWGWEGTREPVWGGVDAGTGAHVEGQMEGWMQGHQGGWRLPRSGDGGLWGGGAGHHGTEQRAGQGWAGLGQMEGWV